MAISAKPHAYSEQMNPTSVLVFGSGACARRVVQNLEFFDIFTQRVSFSPDVTGQRAEEKAKEDLPLKLVDIKGTAGEYQIELRQNGSSILRSAHALVIAEDDIIIPNFKEYGLKPGSQILSLSGLEDQLNDQSRQPLFSANQKVAFLNGWQSESHPAVTKRMVTLCHLIQAEGWAQTFYFTNNLKIAADGVELLSAAAREKGTVFIKSTSTLPAIVDIDEGRITISYHDELANSPFVLTADWVIVDESHLPSQYLGIIAEKLALTQDADGFVQSDNVHRISNATNRRGVFAAGGSRGILSEKGQQEDADRVAVQVLTFLSGGDREPLSPAEINKGRCARCLTCHRLCPHGAIIIADGVAIQAKACFGCGICVAGCPARAIDIQALDVERELVQSLSSKADNSHQPASLVRIVMFGCSRSAVGARDLCAATGEPLPPEVQMVEVPCGGAISSRDLLAAFDHGADGVVLCTCHTDNCKSEVGNRFARQRAQQVQATLQSAGIESERLLISSVAANMGRELSRMLGDFTRHIQALPRW